MQLPYLLKELKARHVSDDEREKADMIFSTVHRCKGMEYDQVSLLNDFTNETAIIKLVREKGKKNININALSEEVNLLYVAATRTKNVLNIPHELRPSSKINIYDADAPQDDDFKIDDFELEDDFPRFGQSYRKEIAAYLDRTEGAIRARLKKLGID